MRQNLLYHAALPEVPRQAGAASIGEAFDKLTGENAARPARFTSAASWALPPREGLRFIQQRERFIAALVRPLVWLVVFAAGFRSARGMMSRQGGAG